MKNIIKEGQVIIYHTCDAIDPVTCQEFGKRDEKLLNGQELDGLTQLLERENKNELLGC